MDNNHRIVTVNEIKYAWSISKGIDEYTEKPFNDFKYIRVWKKKTKKIVFEQKISSDKIIDGKIVTKLIKANDYIGRNVVIAEPCPFCQGKVKEHPNPEWREFFYACYHDENCFLCEGKKPMNFTLINSNHINKWNYRNNN